MNGERLLWVDSWWSALGGDAPLPGPVAAVLALSLAFLFVVLPSAYWISLLHRKFAADLQARVGPNRAGPGGLGQPLADFLKLIQKEGRQKRSRAERIWMGVHTFALFSTLAVLPLGTMALLVDTEISVFIPFWSLLVLALGAMWIGLSRPSVPGWFGGIRAGAQTLTGAFPALLCVLTAGMRADGFSWSALAGSQGANLLSWGLWGQPPFQLIAFGVFLFSGLILLGAEPFDAAVSKGDIQGGVGANLEGRDLAMFSLGRFYGFFFWSVMTVVIFLGAWNLPRGFSDWLREQHLERLLAFLELSVLLAKTWLLMLGVVWFARSNPRVRADQVTELSWRVLGPLALGALLGATLWSAGGWGL